MTQTVDTETFLLDENEQDALFRAARSARTFSDEPVTDETIESVYDLVRWGPTALNTVPLRLLLVRTPEARAALAGHMGEGNRERVLAAPLSIVVAADTDFHERLDTLMPHLPGVGQSFAADAEHRTAMARDNAWLQTGYLLVGLRAAGLDVGPMNGMDAAAIDADLLAGTTWRSLVVLNVGYPAADNGAFPRAPRLAFDEASTVI